MKYIKNNVAVISIVLVILMFVFILILKNKKTKVDIDKSVPTVNKEEYTIKDNDNNTYTIYDSNGNPIKTVDETQEEGMKGVYQDNPFFNPRPV